jgi:hypothetical protein
LTNKHSHNFRIILVDSSKAETCASNQVIKSTTAVDGTVRENEVSYTISTDPSQAQPFTIKAKDVFGSIEGCDLITSVEYFNEWGCNAAATATVSGFANDFAINASAAFECNGAWEPWFDPLAVFEFEADQDMQIVWNINQQHWFDHLQHQAIYNNRQLQEDLAADPTRLAEYKPQSYHLRLRFVTRDPTCFENCNPAIDEVSVNIHSSGQLKGDLCDFSAVTTAEPFTGTRKYEVSLERNDSNKVRFLVETSLVGAENLGRDCGLTMTLETQIDGQWIVLADTSAQHDLLMHPITFM